MGLKPAATGNTLEEHIENLVNIVGTHWEFEWNMLGTKEKKSSPGPQNLKEKKSKHFECLLSLLVGCMKFLFPKLFITVFGLG
jgi:hypothetical protein